MFAFATAKLTPLNKKKLPHYLFTAIIVIMEIPTRDMFKNHILIVIIECPSFTRPILSFFLSYASLFSFLHMQESLIINTLQFNMSVPTPYVFMLRFLKAAKSDKKARTFFCLESKQYDLYMIALMGMSLYCCAS